MNWSAVVCDPHADRSRVLPASDVVRVLPPRRRRGACGSRTGIDLDAGAGLVAHAARPALLMVRDRMEPDVVSLAALAHTVGHRVVRLPDDADAAGWVVSLAVAFTAAPFDAAVRAIEVLCAGPGAVAGAPTRPWGGSGIQVPALRPATIARWAHRAWRPCGWCTRGGCGGHPCAACGAPTSGAVD